MSRTRIDSVIAFLREAFRDDGAEGESVHLLCREVEAMQRDLKAAHEEIDALRGVPDHPARPLSAEDTVLAQAAAFRGGWRGR